MSSSKSRYWVNLYTYQSKVQVKINFEGILEVKLKANVKRKGTSQGMDKGTGKGQDKDEGILIV